ncbi:MAG: sugar ABC transporter permease [Oscillospiraceae bacterium]|nr:sugar ABC transporter permease [Oscillospiraceae bacterium]
MKDYSSPAYTIRRKLRPYKGFLYLLPSIIILCVFTIYPLIKTFVMSFMEDYNLVNDTYTAINLENYKELFSDATFLAALKNTGIYVIFVVPISVILSLIIAVFINDVVRGKAIFQTLYFLPYVTSVIAIGLVWRWMFNSNYGLINSILNLFGIDSIGWLNETKYAMPALIIFSVWKSLAFNILIFLSGLQTIPQDIYRAARVDSTPKMRVFFRLTVPQMKPIIVYAFMMGFISAFKVYNEVYSLFGGTRAGPANSAITVVYYIYAKFYNSYRYGIAAAAAVVLFVIIFVFTMIERYVTRDRDKVKSK